MDTEKRAAQQEAPQLSEHEKAERRKLTQRVRRDLDRGLLPDEIVETLVAKGRPREWSERFVRRIDDQLQDDLSMLKRRDDPAQDVGGSGAWIGAAVGFILGLIGVVLVLVFSKEPATRRAALWGFGVRLAVSLVAFLALR